MPSGRVESARKTWGRFPWIGGSALAHYDGFVDPEVVASPILIISIILFTVVGGIGTLWGPVVGVALLFPFGEILRGSLANSLPGLHLVVFGATLVAVIRLMPNGIFGWVVRRFRSASPLRA